MELSEARIDLNGNLVAEGRVYFKSDATGQFVCSQHNCVKVSIRRAFVRLAPATVSREPASHFMTAEETGSFVILPQSLAVEIQSALTSNLYRPVKVMLATDAGHLTSDASGKGSAQTLSDWTLEILKEGNRLKIEISAALLRTEPAPTWHTSKSNFWTTTDGTPERISIEFYVDYVTRTAAFGIFLPESEDALVSAQPQTPSTTAINPSLKDAPIGTMGEIFGFTQAGGWVKILTGSFGAKSIGFEQYNPQKRLTNGFIPVTPAHRFPRISLDVIDMDQIVNILEKDGNRVSIEMHEGRFGNLQDEPREPGLEIQSFLLNLQLNLAGLDFAYKISRDPKMSNPIEGRFTLPWEVIILRYPSLANYRLDVIRRFH